MKTSTLFMGRVVWITGATSGLGYEMALAFAREGAKLAVSGRRENLLEKVVRAIGDLGQEAFPVPCDVTNEKQLAEVVKKVVKHYGGLDVAVANAGFGIKGKIEDITGNEWRRQLDVNVTGLAMTARYALPHLKKTHGRLALVGSVGAMISSPGTGAYSASKAAVRVIGQMLAMELGNSGVSCTTLHPGFIDTNITRIDNQGNFDPHRKDPRPARLMWKADTAARVMVKAIYKRKREYTFTRHGRIFSFIGRHWPGLAHHVMVRSKR